MFANDFKNNPKVFCFGDSWAYGAELNRPQVLEHPFIHWFASELGMGYKNYGEEGASLGIILHRLVTQIKNITKRDIVLIIIPPDIRWYDENRREGFHSLMNWRQEDYFKSLNNKTLAWFKYHHALFIYSIQKILDDTGCYYIMAHNYGQIEETKNFNLKIDYDRFLSTADLTNLLSEVPHNWRSYADHMPFDQQMDEDGPLYNHEFSGKYFKGTVNHPNELGHKRIAELFLEKYYNDSKK
jgi:hypothetical protein